MKRLAALLIVLLATPAFAGQNPAYPVPNANANFMSNLQNYMNNEKAQEDLEHQFTNFIYDNTVLGNACLGAPAPGLTMTIPGCVAYDAGWRNVETNSITFPNNSSCWVAMDSNTTGTNTGLPTFTRIPNTHYLIDCNSPAAPALPFNAQYTMLVLTVGGSVVSVTDNRITGFGAVMSGIFGAGSGLQIVGRAADPTADVIEGMTIGATTPAPASFTNLTGNGHVSITGTNTDGSDQVSHVSVNGVLNALVFPGADIGAKVNAAATQLGNAGGTIFIPAGTYTYATPIALTKNTCNVMISGDSQGGTILKPNFTGDAISFIDSAAENPPTCKGGVRDIQFLTTINLAPNNLNLIHVSNVLGLDLRNIYALNFNGTNDTTIYLDPGVGPAGTTFTERIHMFNIVSMYSQHMLRFNGGNTGASFNNNQLNDSHCDTSYDAGSSCIRIENDSTGSTLSGSRFDFDGNLNAADTAAVSFSSNSNGGPFNGAELNFRVQAVPTAFCLNSDTAAPIVLAARGSANCYNANHNVVPYFQDKTRTQAIFIPTTSGFAAPSYFGAYAPSYFHKTSAVVSLQAFATTAGAGCATAPIIDLNCNATDQTSMQITLGNGLTYFDSVPALPIECDNSQGIGVVIHTAAAGCGTYPGDINIILEMAEGMPNQ